jgi:hypothetical protein
MTTTLFWKLNKGTVLIALPNGKKVVSAFTHYANIFKKDDPQASV